jgi:hypothetical protein
MHQQLVVDAGRHEVASGECRFLPPQCEQMPI